MAVPVITTGSVNSVQPVMITHMIIRKINLTYTILSILFEKGVDLLLPVPILPDFTLQGTIANGDKVVICRQQDTIQSQSILPLPNMEAV